MREGEREGGKKSNNERAGADPEPGKISTHTLPSMRGNEIKDVFLESPDPQTEQY